MKNEINENEVSNIIKIRHLLLEPFNLDILELCDGNNSIRDISKKIKLSYKSTFFKIKQLGGEGIIVITKPDKNGGKSKIIISEKYRQDVDDYLHPFKNAKQNINQVLSDNISKQLLYNYLKLIKNRRYTTPKEADTLRVAMDVNYNFDKPFEYILFDANLIKLNIEISRKGLRVLKQLENDFKKSPRNKDKS